MVASAPPVTPPCVEMGWRQEWDNWGFLASILAPVSIRDLVSGNMVESDGGFCLSLAPRPDVQSPRTYVLESTCMCARACAHIYTHRCQVYKCVRYLVAITELRIVITKSPQVSIIFIHKLCIYKNLTNNSIFQEDIVTI